MSNSLLGALLALLVTASADSEMDSSSSKSANSYVDDYSIDESSHFMDNDTTIYLTLYLNETSNSTYLEEISRDEFYEDFQKSDDYVNQIESEPEATTEPIFETLPNKKVEIMPENEDGRTNDSSSYILMVISIAWFAVAALAIASVVIAKELCHRVKCFIPCLDCTDESAVLIQNGESSSESIDVFVAERGRGHNLPRVKDASV